MYIQKTSKSQEVPRPPSFTPHNNMQLYVQLGACANVYQSL